ncbi:MAG: hypothetical protein VX583_03805 [Bdellovibrionota bacterium]
MPNFIALDLALLPHEKHQDNLVRWNHELYQKGKVGYLFDANHLPHLTLFQNFIIEDDIEPLICDLNRLSISNKLSEISSKEFSSSAYKDNSSVVMLNFFKSDELTHLQKKVHKIFEKYSQTPELNSALMAFNQQPITEAVDWIQNFHKKASLSNFSPHITLGFSQIEQEAIQQWNLQIESPWQFSNIALSQMGNYCSMSNTTFWEQKIETYNCQ